jgi:UDP-GlcNAc:undecaprenyl-phosphate GlcNAc-1-phosphate transferase
MSSYKVASTTVATLLLPVLILAVPILDTTLVTVVRFLERRPISKGGRDHTSHRLVERGLSEKRAVILLGTIAAMLGGTSLTYSVVGNNRITLVGVLLTFVLLVQFATFLGDVKRDAELPEGATARVRPLVLNLGRLLETLVDFAVITAAFAVSYFLLVIGSGSTYERHVFMVSLPAILAARFAAFLAFGIYRRLWRYAGSRDAVAIGLAVVVSELVAFLFLFATIDFGSLTRTIFIIDALVCILMVGAARFGERALSHVLSSLRGRDTRHRTLIVGAGREGRSLVRELRETPGELIVGFIDDDPALHRRKLLGVPVVGSTAGLAATLLRLAPDAVLVTALDLPHETLDAIVAACEEAGVPCRFVRRDLDVAPETVLRAVAGGL